VSSASWRLSGRRGRVPRRPARYSRFLTPRRKTTLLALGLIAPALGLRLLTGFWPFVDTGWISFHRSNPTLGPDVWNGIDNYRRVLSSLTVHSAIFFTALFTFASTIAELAVGLAIALLLNARFRLASLARPLNLIPWAIPVVVTGIAFRYGLDREFGLFADAFARITGIKPDWLLDVWPARIAVIATNVWRNAPFVAIVLLAGLQAIPEELYEAGRVDGGSSWFLFRRITLPLVAPILISIGVFFLIYQIASFDLVLSMTGGGPGEATQVVGYQAYIQAFQGLDFGGGAALSMVLFLFVALIGLLGTAALRRVEAHL
jgi:multiple sugar transport system permease protein